MKTVLSHIVQKRLSMENENVATEALNFTINSSEAALTGLINFFHEIAPELPRLRFQTQQTEENMRPDMCGLDSNEPRVYIENKFWAGLTGSQPVSYVKLLAEYTQPTVLLAVVPEARQETIWRELLQRLDGAKISFFNRTPTSNIYSMVETDIGPLLALTSWTKLLSAIELELTNEPKTRNDLLQLRSLCDAADSDAFIPLSEEELTNQRYPQLILQLNTVVQKTIEQGVTAGFLNTQGLRPMASWEQIGRYISFTKAQNAYAWFGIHFKFWQQYGGTPLWLCFWNEKWGRGNRGNEVQAILKPWAKQNGVIATMEDRYFIVGIDLAAGEEVDNVVRFAVKRLNEISEQISVLQNNGV